jgi:hypothetical protein
MLTGGDVNIPCEGGAVLSSEVLERSTSRRGTREDTDTNDEQRSRIYDMLIYLCEQKGSTVDTCQCFIGHIEHDEPMSKGLFGTTT